MINKMVNKIISKSRMRVHYMHENVLLKEFESKDEFIAFFSRVQEVHNVLDMYGYRLNERSKYVLHSVIANALINIKQTFLFEYYKN